MFENEQQATANRLKSAPALQGQGFFGAYSNGSNANRRSKNMIKNVQEAFKSAQREVSADPAQAAPSALKLSKLENMLAKKVESNPLVYGPAYHVLVQMLTGERFNRVLGNNIANPEMLLNNTKNITSVTGIKNSLLKNVGNVGNDSQASLSNN